MASATSAATKIKEGLLQISWDAPRNRVNSGLGYVNYNVSHNTGKPTQTQINVSTLTKCFDTCVLTCKTENGQQIILEMEIQITKKHVKQLELETISVHATKDRMQQKMTLDQSKWTATWNVPTNSVCQQCPTRTNCDYCGREIPLSFDILIDVIPDSVVSLKRGSQHVLDHLLNLWNAKTLSDVTFNCKKSSIKAHTLILVINTISKKTKKKLS
jgi:hypothetical protein